MRLWVPTPLGAARGGLQRVPFLTAAKEALTLRFAGGLGLLWPGTLPASSSNKKEGKRDEAGSKLFPQLALDVDNLQILCHECNHGKGNWDMTDWRTNGIDPEAEDHLKSIFKSF